MPGLAERYKLWTQSIPHSMTPEADINWHEIAEKYEITGAEIVNVMYYATLKAHSLNTEMLIKDDLYEGIKKELKKQDKTFSY